MRKKLLLLMVVCGFTLESYGQVSDSWYKNIAIFGGVNVSYINGEKLSDSPRIGYTLGFTYDFDLPQNMALTTGLQLTTKGGQGYDNQRNIKSDWVISYLQCPITLGYKIQLNKISVAPYIGGFYSYCFRDCVSSSGGGKVSLSDRRHNPTSKYLRNSDLGIRAGCNFRWHQVVVGLGYDLGLFDVAEKQVLINGNEYINVNNTWKTNSCYLTVGWHF